MDSTWISANTAAKRFGLDTATILKLIRTHGVTHCRIPGVVRDTIRIDPNDLDQLLRTWTIYRLPPERPNYSGAVPTSAKNPSDPSR